MEYKRFNDFELIYQVRENDDVAYNLGKNLWYNRFDEDKIKEQLTKYADSKQKKANDSSN